MPIELRLGAMPIEPSIRSAASDAVERSAAGVMNIREHAILGLRRGDHLAGECFELVEAARPNKQFNPPRNRHRSRRQSEARSQPT